MCGELIEAHGAIAKNQARLRVLEQQRAELELIKASRSWRWTRPWRFAMRTLRARVINDLDSQRLRQLIARRKSAPANGGPRVVVEQLAQTPVRAAPAAIGTTVAVALSIDAAGSRAVKQRAVVARVEPASQLKGLRDYFVWAVIDWHFRIQRPQHLSRELAAAGHRVFYISNNFVDDPAPGFTVDPQDSVGNLFQVHLNLQGAPQIYHAAPDRQQCEQLRASLGELLAWTRTRGCVSLMEHPYWLETARILPDAWVIYDCMDHHGGFADNDAEVLAREGELMRDADLLIVTSDWLYEETGKYNPHRLMVRNACQYEHFAHRCANPFKDPRGRKVIGYYGAIAEWFDLDLVEKVAKRFTDCLILLVGNDTVDARGRLGHLPNVGFTGEVPYASLPAYLDGFDVCMLPFQIIPLTLATNPVKVYEYLSAGKDVVSVALPEIRQFGELVRTARDHGEFLDAVGEALQTPSGPSSVTRRQHFAAQQTWAHRVQTLTEGVSALRGPKVSVIVLTYNNLDLTKVCLASVEQFSDYDNMEVIVVDNASTDGTPDFLREWTRDHDDRRIILNSENLGFAAGNNVGLAAADSEYLVLLNNDTHVTPGWVATLMGHLRRNEKLGMIGPVTNNIGNEARIDVHYDDMEGMLKAAADYTARRAGQSMPLRTAAFFCVMMRWAVYEQVGPMDEAFGVGFFEDDDYCRRVEQAGWGIACAEDVFVHHHLSASFNKLKQEKKQAMFEQNKAIYEAKWGPWKPHRYRVG
ncbi:MAG TPA: glycosyltransferase [Rhodanobacteraceae bacterium]|nr:glycosyltransferase [Rhodanobacteraceae bacterium]